MRNLLSQNVKRLLRIPVLLLIGLLISCQSDAQLPVELPVAHDVRYYTSLVFRETPYAQQKGLVKLSAVQAKKRGHYRITRDSKAHIVEIAFMQGEHYKTPNHTTGYYQFPAPVVRTKYEGNTEIKSFYNHLNTQISVRGQVYLEVYELDSLGNRKHLYFLDKNGSEIENEWGVAAYHWQLQDDGSVIEKREDLQGKPQPLRPYFLFYTTRLHYDPQGYISLMQNVDADGNLVENSTGVAQDKLEFDHQGRWLGWKVLDKEGRLTEGNGPNVAKGINTPDEFGYETAIRYEDRHGNPKRNDHGFWGSRRFYDDFGNLSRSYFTDSIGNPAPNVVSGYTYAIYTWDTKGMKRVSTQLLGTDKLPIDHKTRGYSSITYTYDDRGLLSQVSFLDRQGKPINRLDNGVAYIKYSYDTGGVRTSRKEFNTNHKELKP
ncbi:hypothetical protein [Spongiimicrobium sp. 2-473A-2-J]|uniref:hypothetical protein n=1 Tax=Eudoraea algarum TaxID=3417568 RepID=UPI003D36FC9A